jgi:acyl-CoA synthetase (AMP-forming)/AMP-acid ligase II
MLGDLCHFGDLLTRNARGMGERESFVMGEERYTWRQSEARANRLAHALRKRGLHRGDRVAILSENRISFAEAIFALARSGLVVVPINVRLVKGEVARILDDCEVASVLADDAHLELARDSAGQVESVHLLASLEEGGGIVPSYRTLLDEGEERAPPLDEPIADDEVLALLYTSGTSGFPKGVMYTHRRALRATIVQVLATGSARHHVVMLSTPLYSAAGFLGIASAVAEGSPCHLLRFTVASALATLARERVTFTSFVPTTLQRILEHPHFGDYDLSSLEVLLYGGCPMPAATLRHAAEALQAQAPGGCGLRQTFATAETGLAGTVLEPEDHRFALARSDYAHLLLSCGRPQTGVKVRILDADWENLPDGELGEIAVSSDANMVGYWNRPEATTEVLQGSWVKTGDLARRDADGYFYLIDRKNDMIVTGATNVYPSEVERTLADHEAVADCAVTGLPHPRWGEAVTAFIVRHEGAQLDEAAVKAFCRRRLASYKRPKSVYFIDEIPRNPAGRALRRQLRLQVSDSQLS